MPTGSTTGSEREKPRPKEIAITTLLGEGHEVVLIHNGERYRLRITANGKLILTK